MKGIWLPVLVSLLMLATRSDKRWLFRIGFLSVGLLAVIGAAFYLWALCTAIVTYWEYIILLPIGTVYAIANFLAVHWIPIVAILAILALWEIVRLLRIIANTRGTIDQRLARHAEQEEDAAADDPASHDPRVTSIPPKR
jgi:hypothetical protein